MRTLTAFLLALAAVLLIATEARAQSTATQNVTVVVEQVNAISLTGGAITLTIDAATPGTGLTADTESTSTYDVTTNGSGIKITGQLDGAYAAGISLDVLLDAPTGATATQRTLTTVAQDLVTGISNLSESGLGISYTASATESAATNDPAGETQTVTYTITN